ncbi:MAG TPA: mitochondrial fission ELM1 family protein [Patescibacteria group bacterium]|nr:mitochondrial fission ELM1 family protein [Patescibacteria group bacterium]
MENQCLGLAEALGIPCEVRRVKRPGAPWKYLPPDWWPHPLNSVSEGKKLAPPWPDVLISSGRGSVAAALAVKKASGGKTFAVHIQTPYVDPAKFDLVVVPAHDALRGPNVIVARTALHRITNEKLTAAADHFRPLFAELPRPLISVLVGGSNKRAKVSPEIMTRLADRLADAAHKSGGSLAVTPSRRTGKENETILRERLRDVPAYIWDGSGENPYFGLLALADAIVATGDSVSMVSEACATGKPVYIFDLGDDGRKMRAFHKSLREASLTRPFAGIIEMWSYSPVNETVVVANAIRERMKAKSGEIAAASARH